MTDFTRQAILQTLTSTLTYYSENTSRYTESIALNEVLAILPDNDTVSGLFSPSELAIFFESFQCMNILALMYEAHDNSERYASEYPSILNMYSHLEPTGESFADAYNWDNFNFENLGDTQTKVEIIVEISKTIPETKCDCPICFEEIEPLDQTIITGCKHTFCVECMSNLTKNSCPMCRADINEVNVFTENARCKLTDSVII